MSITCKRFDSL